MDSDTPTIGLNFFEAGGTSINGEKCLKVSLPVGPDEHSTKSEIKQLS